MSERDTPATLTFLGTSSGQQGCPTIFVTDRGTLVIQGTTVTDPAAVEAMRARGNGLPDDESAVEVPAELLPFILAGALDRLPFADEERPAFQVDPDAAESIAAVLQEIAAKVPVAHR